MRGSASLTILLLYKDVIFFSSIAIVVADKLRPQYPCDLYVSDEVCRYHGKLKCSEYVSLCFRFYTF
jgi:hypothetical protein